MSETLDGRHEYSYRNPLLFLVVFSSLVVFWGGMAWIATGYIRDVGASWQVILFTVVFFGFTGAIGVPAVLNERFARTIVSGEGICNTSVLGKELRVVLWSEVTEFTVMHSDDVSLFEVWFDGGVYRWNGKIEKGGDLLARVTAKLGQPRPRRVSLTR